MLTKWALLTPARCSSRKKYIAAERLLCGCPQCSPRQVVADVTPKSSAVVTLSIGCDGVNVRGFAAERHSSSLIGLSQFTDERLLVEHCIASVAACWSWLSVAGSQGL